MRPEFPPEWLDETEEAPEPYWTVRRIILTIIILITLIAFLVYTLSWVIAPPAAPIPPPPTRQLV